MCEFSPQEIGRIWVVLRAWIFFHCFSPRSRNLQKPAQVLHGATFCFLAARKFKGPSWRSPNDRNKNWKNDLRHDLEGWRFTPKARFCDNKTVHNFKAFKCWPPHGGDRRYMNILMNKNIESVDKKGDKSWRILLKAPSTLASQRINNLARSNSSDLHISISWARYNHSLDDRGAPRFIRLKDFSNSTSPRSLQHVHSGNKKFETAQDRRSGNQIHWNTWLIKVFVWLDLEGRLMMGLRFLRQTDSTDSTQTGEHRNSSKFFSSCCMFSFPGGFLVSWWSFHT